MKSAVWYIDRRDDMTYERLWRASDVLTKIYDLYVVQAYSAHQTAEKIGTDIYCVLAMIDGVRCRYKINFIGRLKRIIYWKLSDLKLSIFGSKVKRLFKAPFLFAK